MLIDFPVTGVGAVIHRLFPPQWQAFACVVSRQIEHRENAYGDNCVGATARGQVPAGSEAQIDYGKLGMWFDPVSGRRVMVWAFVMVLAHSRHMFVQPVLKTHQSSRCVSHVAAFEFFGGVPARLVPDNLKTGVARPDLYDPKINKAYAELGAHYGCLIDPARANKLKDKPRVERAHALRSGLVLARPGVHLAAADAGRRAHLVSRRRRGPHVPGTRR